MHWTVQNTVTDVSDLIPPCLVATLIFPEADGSRNLLDPGEKPAQDKCCLPWLVSHENQGSQTPLGGKKTHRGKNKEKNRDISKTCAFP